MDYIDLSAFYDSLSCCLTAVSLGVILGFTLRFLVFGICKVWELFKSIAR